jgi:putative colanic acid biosynthesis acetyltransferase WcaF
MKVDVTQNSSPHSFRNKAGRVLWGFAWALLYRPTPKIFHGWRRFLLRLFGARIGRGVHVYQSARIWAPWNLEMGDHSCLSHDVDCYCVAPIRIGPHATVSQYSYLCAASHDFEDPLMPLVTAPITIGNGAWVAADVFVGPGVKVGEGAVVGARSSVFSDVEPWTVVAGNPARFLKKRQLSSESPPVGFGPLSAAA